MTYIRGYESRYLFRNKKHRIRKATRRRPDASIQADAASRPGLIQALDR